MPPRLKKAKPRNNLVAFVVIGKHLAPIISVMNITFDLFLFLE
jgi:hypothetical protein